MVRLLLVIEDYGERMYLQTVLKKLGMDVDSIPHPRGLSEALLRMNPDILLMTGTGGQVNGLELSRGVSRRRGLPHVILTRPTGSRPIEAPEYVRWIESPVSTPKLLDQISESMKLDSEILRDKYAKLRAKTAESSGIRDLNYTPADDEPSLARSHTSSSNLSMEPSAMSSQDRAERYSKFLKGDMPSNSGFSVKRVEEQVKELRSQKPTETQAELERQRQEFVRQLFKNKG